MLQSSLPPKISVAILMGSDSDFPVMEKAGEALSLFGISYLFKILSAHRTPLEMADFAQKAHVSHSVLIAGAGGAAHLPGMVAAHTVLPVIGVPVPIGPLEGQDALYSIVQMPKGVPVATVAIGNAFNAGLLAAQILGVGDSSLSAKLEKYRARIREESSKKTLRPKTYPTLF